MIKRQLGLYRLVIHQVSSTNHVDYRAANLSWYFNFYANDDQLQLVYLFQKMDR